MADGTALPPRTPTAALLVGGALIVLGSLLPLTHSTKLGALLPDVASRVPEASLLPGAGFLLLAFGACLIVVRGPARLLLGGLTIALASPGLALPLVLWALTKANLVLLARPAEAWDLGPGQALWIAGSLLSLLGSFAALAEARA